MTENQALDAAYLAVPEIAEYHARRKRVADLLTSLPIVDAPEAAAQKIADDAVSDYLTSGAWDESTNERAQAAYTAAVGAHAVRTRLSVMHREFISGASLRSLYEANRDEILTNLGTQLSALLEEARKHIADLGDVRTADQAIDAGAKASAAYASMRPLVAQLTDIRAAQWVALGAGEEGGPMSRWTLAKTSGFGDLQGISDDTPFREREVMRRQSYDLEHLVYIAQLGTAYVPADVDEVLAAQEAFDGRHSTPDDVRPLDISPRVAPHRTPRQPNRGTDTNGEREAVSRARQRN
ncbi:hypothetical protein ACFVW8_03860 [Streptomyces sp. NPDC058221]|uniref:hypothetical protein n=1 Tax=Streptomyces sp. NPDC058221 TaxID=3346388 RepID=UPI0036E453CB